MITGDALTAWLILKAPLPVAIVYLYMAVKGDRQAILITVFFFPYVFLLIKNLWLEIVHAELVTKLKFDSGLEIEVNKKLFKITRFGIVACAVAELYVIPYILNVSGAPSLSDIPVMIVVALVLIFTIAVFFWQIRFAIHTGRLLHVLETKRKFDMLKEPGKNHRIKMASPGAFSKGHKRIKSVIIS